ncbi:thymidine kinase [Candidatus Aenigmatarchaeota archaeon]
MSKLEVICGPMFCGKSEELIRRLKRIQIAKKKIIAFKPSIDDRYDKTRIASHSGAFIDAVAIDTTKESIESIVEKSKDADVVGIDEIQFFDDHIINIVDFLIDGGKEVVVAGLDKDFRKEPFGPMPMLLAKADYVIKLDAICVKCGELATTTQRIIEGKPAKYSDPIKLVGQKDKYEARCRKCHEILK